MDKLEDHLRIAQRSLEEAVIEAEKTDFLPKLLVFREDEWVAMLTGDHEHLAHSAMMVAPCFGATELIFVADVVGTNSATNPEGERWEEGEMERRVREPAVAALVTEALGVLQVKRGRDGITLGLQPYRRAPGRVEWGELQVSAASGGLAEILNDAMKAKPLEVPLPTWIRDSVPEQQIRVLEDAATAVHITSEFDGRLAVALRVPDEDWARMIVERVFAAAEIDIDGVDEC